jgi:hypothetical protein
MKQPSPVFAELDDWSILSSFLPEGWQRKAFECGALRRTRRIAGPDALLRILLIHIANGCSLSETSVRAGQLGLGRLNSSAIYKRLRGAEEWLRWMAEQMRMSLGFAAPVSEQRIRAVDATTVVEPGSTGTDWRIHYCFNLANLQCDFFQLTDASGGESWKRFPVRKGDILLGDRGYANPNGVGHVVAAGGEVVVRLNRAALPLFDNKKGRIDPVHLARTLKPHQDMEWKAWVHVDSGKKRVRGRLIAVRRSHQASEEARKKLRQRASRNQNSVSPEALEAAQYFFLWTTLPPSWSRAKVLQLYRYRWQIELAFKRMKSIMGLGHLPKKDPESCRAWLHGKLLTSLLVEHMIGTAQKFSPWGYELDTAQEQVA